MGQQFLMATFKTNEKTRNACKGIIVKEYYLRISIYQLYFESVHKRLVLIMRVFKEGFFNNLALWLTLFHLNTVLIHSFIHSFSFTSILPSFLTYLIIVQWLIRRPDEEGLSASLIKHWTSMKDYIKDVSAVSLNFLSSCSVFLLAQNPKSGVSFLSFLHFMDFAFSTLFFLLLIFLGLSLRVCLFVFAF